MNNLSRFFVERPFDFNELRRTVVQIQGAQRFNAHLSKIPLIGKLAAAQGPWISKAEARRFLRMIDAMTLEERRRPHLIDIPQNRRRVAIDTGLDQADVFRMVAQFDAMADHVNRLTRMGFTDRIRFMMSMLRDELDNLRGKTKSQSGH